MDAIDFELTGRNGAVATDAVACSDDILHATNVVRLPSADRGEAALASLASGPMAGRFCAWRGASGRRYITSVYPVDRRAPDGGLPAYERFVLISVARGADRRRILGVASVERASARRAVLLMGMARGADEWHIHVLAEDRAARDAAVSDLDARHGTPCTALRA